jgi:hypothetical protein
LYSISSKESLLELATIREQILQQNSKGTTPLLVLCANKRDPPHSNHQAELSEGATLAETWKIPFFATSAISGKNIQEAVAKLALFHFRKTANDSVLLLKCPDDILRQIFRMYAAIAVLSVTVVIMC